MKKVWLWYAVALAIVALLIFGPCAFEKLRAQEARPFFESAIAEDPEFAMSYLFLSFVATSAKGFWENLGKATELVGKVSQGERLWILGVEAGAHAYARPH